MKPIKNLSKPILSVDLHYQRFLHCFGCHKPMPYNTYMHDKCWHQANRTAKQKAQDVLRAALFEGRREVEVDEVD